jgi:hypothetical protein
MATSPPPENSLLQVRKLRVMLGERLALLGAFSFFIDEIRKAVRYAL